MHYIIGTVIECPESSVGSGEVISSSGPQPINSQQVRRKVAPTKEETSKFEPGNTYTLGGIRANPAGGMLYTFTTQTGCTVEVVFESVKAAEQEIARLRGESLPNYEDFHNQKI